MKLKTLSKKIKKDLKSTHLLAIIPLTALIWIIWQVTMLSKYNAVAFFSWTQVFSDSAILMLLIIAYFSWLFSNFIFKDLKPNFYEKFRWFMFIVYFIFIFLFLAYLIKYDNIYFLALPAMYIFWYVTPYLDIWAKKISKKSVDKYIFIFPTSILTIVIAGYLVLISFFEILIF